MGVPLREFLKRWHRDVRVRRISALRAQSEKKFYARVRLLAAQNLFTPSAAMRATQRK